MLRSLPRASSSSASLLSNTTAGRPLKPFRSAPPIACLHASTQRQQSRHAHAISNPTLAGIEKRWEVMPPQEQAELWMALRDRMKNDWHDLTLQEKKAAYWIAFGPHGPRALPPPDENRKIFLYTMYGIAASAVIIMIARMFKRPPPKTMTKEYQEMSNEYLKAQRTEPISGVSSEGYDGPGMVQSPPKRD